MARTPRKCLVIWCGDHKQTPGGLRKTDEAKAFRRKLLRRPIALRGDTEHFQPNMLGKIVLRYLEGMDEPLINGIKAIIRETMGGTCLASAEGIAALRTLCQEVGCPFHDELCITTCCTALAVLWMALHKEKFPLLATSLQAAAGVIGHQRWALILPTTARVSLVTYTAVIAVRYPELDNVQNGMVCFGNYLLGEQATSGGFLPIFWMPPQPTCMLPQTLAPLLIGSSARLSSALMRTAVLPSCATGIRWSQHLAIRNGPPSRRALFSQRVLHPVQE